MTVKTGQTWAGAFVTLDATGALEAGTPSGVLYIDGTADAATVTITGSNPYKWAVTLPALTAGQRVDMYITGTIATIATAGFVASEQADTALASEVKAETAAILADTGTDGVVLKAAGLNADAVAEIQSGLALEATLTAIKGAGWTTETLAAIDVLIDAIKAKTDNLPAAPAAVGSAMTLTSAGVDAILDEVVVGTYTMRKLLKLAGTVLAGKLTGGGTNTISFEGLDGTAGVVVATVDGNGNRSSVTITV